MSTHHFNELTVGSLPREAAVGTLGAHVTIDTVVRSLGEANIPPDRLYFMQGEEGASMIERGGSFLARIFEAEVRAKPVAALREGKTLLAVVGVGDDDVDSVRSSLAAAGLENIHYFGRWTYS